MRERTRTLPELAGACGLNVDVLPLTHAESRCLIYVHQWPLRWWERSWPGTFGMTPLQPGEVAADFGQHFSIEILMARRLSGYIAGEATYLMTRRCEHAAV